ncbi:hypothetical protein N7493_007610 [Penicillium malachiteum]|uniref:Capsule polysaccharide biosynthesis protein n=1 Tax=Penicillium malachiteum TaxID=1324776 RepID=A0AAD6MU70_9EURO|nr:hypothetical protein N7493_007610 [Penicillium malachiteum]
MTKTQLKYPIPLGVHSIPHTDLDLRPDSTIDEILESPGPVTSTKNIWFFWHSGYRNMPGYSQRTVRTWHRRLSKKGWTIRVLDRVPGSANNISQYLDTTSSEIFPRAFIQNILSGPFPLQHTSDLVRFPLILKYGGIYADVGLMCIGDVDTLWDRTINNPHSVYEILSYTSANEGMYNLLNYFLGGMPGNEFFRRCHELLLALWAEDGGKESTEGMHASGILSGVKLMGGAFTIEEEDGSVIPADEASRMLTDYIIQGQAASAVMGLVDVDGNWDGPAYVRKKFFAMEFMEGSQLINEMTNWDGQRAFDLMSLSLPGSGEVESVEQAEARRIVEGCLSRSFGFKLAHGLILKVFKVTLGSLWKKNPGSDAVPGTYADWLRYGMIYWAPDKVPESVVLPIIPPTKVGRLLEVSV